MIPTLVLADWQVSWPEAVTYVTGIVCLTVILGLILYALGSRSRPGTSDIRPSMCTCPDPNLPVGQSGRNPNCLIHRPLEDL